MPKKQFTFRLSEGAISTLTKYAKEHNCKNTTEALEQILSDKLLSPREQASEGSGAPDPFADQPQCEQRRIIDNVPNCIIPATHARGPKTIQIPSPLVCEVCQSIRRNLPSKTLQTQTETAASGIQATAPGESFERNQDPSNSTRKNAGQVWCPDGGFWVFPEKCESCKTRTYAAWYECQKQQLRKKGEQVRQLT